MDSNVLLQGFELMLLGMGIVFGFLTLLVFMLRGMSRLAMRLGGGATEGADMSAPIDVADNRHLIAVITAAIASHRASRTS